MLAVNESRTFGSFNVDDVTTAPLRVQKSVPISTDRATLFDYLTTYTSWNEWFAIIDSVEVDSSKADVEGGNGAVRVCNFVDGTSCSEAIYAYEAPTQFAYAIQGENPFMVEDHLALVQLTDNEDGTTQVNYYQYYNHPDLEGMTANVNHLLDAGLATLAEKFAG